MLQGLFLFVPYPDKSEGETGEWKVKGSDCLAYFPEC